jgi:hypothetical protein
LHGAGGWMNGCLSARKNRNEQNDQARGDARYRVAHGGSMMSGRGDQCGVQVVPFPS